MRNSLRDLRFALRQLLKSPAFTLTAVLTLALGIGATTAIFSIVEGVLLRPLPFAHPDRLVVLSDVVSGANLGSNGEAGVTAPEVAAYARNTDSFQSLGAYQQSSYELSGVGAPAEINASRLTAGMFRVLGVPALLGRAFTQQEDEGRQQVAVISYEMWHSRFNGESDILGQKILLDRKTYMIVGVMPRSFEFPLVPGQLDRSELWVPMSFTPGDLEAGAAANWNFSMVGRLKPGITVAQAQQDAERAAAEIVRSFPSFMSGLSIRAVVHPLAEETVQQARPLLRMLFWAVAVVLFIACANLAGLLLVRVIRRRREIAVRLALGAGTAAILRQTLIETLALSVSGGLLGLALAAAALRAGISFLPETLPRIDSISLDWQVVSFAIGVAILTGVACGLIPAVAAARTSVNAALKEGGRTGSAGSGHARLRSALVVSEIAVALVLLIGAGLLLRSFEKLREVNLGFHTDHMLTAMYGLPQRQYSTQTSIDVFNNTLLRRMEQLPGVKAAGIVSQLPASGNNSNSAFLAQGYVAPKGAGIDMAWPSMVLGNYFGAAGIPLLAGRGFATSDTIKSPLVVVVNRHLAQHFWHGQDPIGKRLRWGIQTTPTPWMTVVGEVGDVRQTSPDAPIRYQVYQPFSQNMASYGSLAPPGVLNAQGGTIVLRTTLAPAESIDDLTAAVRGMDPQLPLTQIESMDRAVSEAEAPRRFNAALISSFAAAAVLLALLGIYSVIAFSTAMRMHEMAIRLALGSQRSSVMKLIVASGARLGLIGCGLGAIAAIFATRLLRSLLFDVDTLDPGVILLAALTLFALALAASFVPARRAAAVELVDALRSE
ncbi:MAG TPA: ABC transporter permease [Terracidiphilus sp.]|nr:ABC transporter permease [Terracidiphilus sp.]